VDSDKVVDTRNQRSAGSRVRIVEALRWSRLGQ
jgi:hypothetical protein